jgi:hypothetical protein
MYSINAIEFYKDTKENYLHLIFFNPDEFEIKV